MSKAIYQSTAVDDAGNVLPNAEIEVRVERPGLPLAQIYSDRAGSNSPGNPFSAQPDGSFAFYTTGGTYSIKATSGATTRTTRDVAIGTAGEYDASDLLFSYAINFSVSGLPAIGEALPAHILPLSMQLPVDFEGSFAKSDLPATAETVVTIYHDDDSGPVAIGTVIFAAASSVGVLSAASAVTLSPGDRLWPEFPNPRDMTLSNISMTFLATRQDGG